jgi:hypothetical protein
LGIREAPSTAQRFVELDDDNAPVNLGLGKSELRGKEPLLRLQNFVVV